jgi:hypothetical protein
MSCFQLFQRIEKHNMHVTNLIDTERSWNLHQISEAMQYHGHIVRNFP